MLINQQKLNEVLKAFYDLTKVRIAVVDGWYNEIASYPKEICAFCLEMRKNDKFLIKCNECDQSAFNQVKKTGKQYTYRCHAGLYESVYPISVDDKVVGYLMIGQFIDENDHSVIEQLAKKDYNAQVSSLVNQLSVFNASRMYSLAEIMMVCAEYLCFSKTISPKESGYGHRIKEYVDTHLSEQITVDAIASYFGVSRTGIYLIFKREFGKGITDYVNSRKIK